MGVEMGGRAADEAAEFGQLASDLGPHSPRVLGRNNRVEWDPFVMAIDPFAQIKMKADADFAVLASVGGGGGGGGLADDEVTGPRCCGWTGGAWHRGSVSGEAS